VGNDRWVAAVAHKYNAGNERERRDRRERKAVSLEKAGGTKSHGGALHSPCKAVSTSST